MPLVAWGLEALGLGAYCLPCAIDWAYYTVYTYRPVQYIYTYTTPDWLVGPSYLGALFDRTGRTCLCSALALDEGTTTTAW